ncbi:LysM domain-containing protein [Kribbella orskensis]|uniref:LysM domain-containing protein n=1 Tax=Kribbella orskensis TaxID=2512216 RepID=A0ABY2BK26_9ACTN|nr:MULTISPECIES: transglycosylase family protein [Kribbella]TCN40213.1 LysM domain-containing protein [Kribbella sp. VKM Ac-2500]TCO22833.1 LysM domain-containing protein [Kribbella orskensis]
MSKARHARPRRSTRRVVRTISIAGLGAGITAAGAGAAFATDYTVKPGDTLSEIAQANGADWHELARLNNLKDPDLILIGQTLQLDGVKKSTVRHTERRAKTTKSTKSSRSQSSRPKKTKTVKKARAPRSDTRASGGSANMSSGWRKVANCESGGNSRAVNPAGYYGLFQFDMRTWRSVGGSGSPAQASAGEQLMRAKMLYAQRGASPWPVCGRFLR